MIAFNYNFSNATIEIVNMFGQIVFKNNYAETKNINLNVGQLSSGFYIIKVTAENQTSSKRFIKE